MRQSRTVFLYKQVGRLPTLSSCARTALVAVKSSLRPDMPLPGRGGQTIALLTWGKCTSCDNPNGYQEDCISGVTRTFSRS